MFAGTHSKPRFTCNSELFSLSYLNILNEFYDLLDTLSLTFYSQINQSYRTRNTVYRYITATTPAIHPADMG